MADWNWFFSALSQCSAAIVALIGAFIIAQIINREGQLSLLRREADELIARINEQLSSLNKRYFKWYNDKMREIASSDFSKLQLDIKEEESAIDLDEIIYKLNFSIFDNRKELKELIKGYEPHSNSGTRYLSPDLRSK